MPYRPETPPYTTDDRKYSENLTWPEWIQLRRTRLGWTKQDFTDACAGIVSRSTLWRIEMSLVRASQATTILVEQVLDKAEAEAVTNVPAEIAG